MGTLAREVDEDPEPVVAQRRLRGTRAEHQEPQRQKQDRQTAFHVESGHGYSLELWDGEPLSPRKNCLNYYLYPTYGLLVSVFMKKNEKEVVPGGGTHAFGSHVP